MATEVIYAVSVGPNAEITCKECGEKVQTAYSKNGVWVCRACVDRNPPSPTIVGGA